MKNLPAGLTDNSIEVFKFEGVLKVATNGSICDYTNLHPVLREPFQAELLSEPKTIECLRTEFKLFDADEMEMQFVDCRYAGAFDHIPDLKDGKLKPDTPMCDKLKCCNGYDIVCKAPKGPNGTLSRQEFLIAIKVGQGKQDKEIAYELEIEITTVRTHLSRIRNKLCINNRIEIGLWIQSKGIL
nr:LuxR C-terminal-related transcriptional regulator [uncultured Carboxylicivirga sp.]